MKIDGACHCGDITFEAEIDPESVMLCHCTDCQTLSGCAFRTAVPAQEENFRFLTGKPNNYVKIAESGNPRAQVFCPRCGTQIYAGPVSGPARVFNLRVGTIRQRRELRPRRQYWYRSALDWVTELASIEKVDQQ